MEVSSYQLEDSSYFRPDAACVLNVTPDHLDHHGGMPAYLRAKAGVFRRQAAGDVCVFNADDPRCVRLAAKCRSRKLFFSSSRKGAGLHAWIEKGPVLAVRSGGGVARFRPPALPGVHNLENAMCAALMALSRGAEPAHVQAAFSAFRGAEHRIEFVRRLKGVTFLNDSKATNVDSVLVALKALEGRGKKLWLILGGQDKGSPYAPLIAPLRSQVKAALTIGSAAAKIGAELEGAAKIIAAGTLGKALGAAAAGAEKGDIVLLSPACASFDQFKDFEDRGRKFKALVRRLGRGRR